MPNALTTPVQFGDTVHHILLDQDAYATTRTEAERDQQTHTLEVLNATVGSVHGRFSTDGALLGWFDVHYTDRTLTYTGDHGTFVFRRWGAEDQSNLFRSFDPDMPNLSYIAEKCVAGDVTSFNIDQWRQDLINHVTSEIEDPCCGDTYTRFMFDDVLTEEFATHDDAWSSLTRVINDVDHAMECVTGERYTPLFVRAVHQIGWAVKQMPTLSRVASPVALKVA